MSGKSYPISQGTEIIVEATSGDVMIQGHDGNTVQIREPEDRYRVSQEEGKLLIRSGRGGTRDLTIRIPSESKVSVRLASGDANLEAIDGDCQLKTMSGDISAKALTGSLRVHTMSGDVKVSGSDLRETVFETVSGDCTADMTLDEEGTYKYHSVSGDLRLLVPEDQRLTIVSTSLSGNVRCELPHDAEPKRMMGKARVEVNGGGVEWKVTTTSGNVRVKASKAPSGDGATDDTLDPFADMDAATDAEPQAEAEPFDLGEAKASDSDDSPVTAERRMEVLKAIESGELSVDEGLAKLRTFD